MQKYSEEAAEYARLSFLSDVNPDDALPWVVSFETEFSKIIGTKYSIAVNSGTSGLHASLLACNVKPGDEVISPALTVIMDAFATAYVGAKPVFVDVDPHTWNIDPQKVEEAINSNTKAIIAVSWFGLPANLKELRAIADRYELFLIDDSAETIILPNMGDKPNALPDIRVFSFENNKHITTGGEGGMVTTNSHDLAVRIRKYAGLGYKHLSADKGRTQLDARIFQNPSYRRFDTLGYNYRMTPLSAAVGIGQLRTLPEKLAMRRHCAEEFSKVTKRYSFLREQKVDQEILHSYYTYGVFLDQNYSSLIKWQDIYDEFTNSGGDGFYANCALPYQEPIFEQHFGNTKCPVAETLQLGILAFKTNYLSEEKLFKNTVLLNKVLEKVGV